MWLTTTSNYLLLVTHFVRRIQLWLDTLRFCNHIILTRALAHRLSVRRTPQSRYLSFRFQEIRWLRLRIAADEIVRERSNWKVSLSGAISPSLIHLPTPSPRIFLCISFVVSHFSLPFSLSYYILRFSRIFDDGSFVSIHFTSRNRYSSRLYLPHLCYPSFNLLFSSIISVFIHHSALFHFRRQFCEFCRILTLKLRQLALFSFL